jgi:ABC-type transporter Mla subunit MlaD
MADIRHQTAPKINEVVTNINNVTSGLNARMPQIGKSIDKLESSIASIDRILDENRANIKSSISNIESVTQSAKVSVPLIFGNLSGASADIRTLIAANRMNLSDTMVNLRETSEQLKAASEEIRRAPWRLLYKPEKREADTLNIYDASRSYADAASDLNSAATTLETLMKLRKGGVPVDEKALAEALDRVKAGLARYSQAEDALWKHWGAAAGANGKP